MEDKIFISVNGHIREATEQEANNIREAQANAQTHTANNPDA
jgi:hypothetical protein